MRGRSWPFMCKSENCTFNSRSHQAIALNRRRIAFSQRAWRHVDMRRKKYISTFYQRCGSGNISRNRIHLIFMINHENIELFTYDRVIFKSPQIAWRFRFPCSLTPKYGPCERVIGTGTNCHKHWKVLRQFQWFTSSDSTIQLQMLWTFCLL
jgi:hypothetical protein